MRVAHVMAGARAGGAELFYERLVAAQHKAGDAVLAAVRREPGRLLRLRAAGLVPMALPFGGLLDFTTGPALRRSMREFRPELVMAWMGRAAAAAPRGDWVLAGRLGGRYDLRRFRRCDHLVANTEALVRWIAGQGWPGERVHHLPNFSPDLSGAAPAMLDVPAGSPLVLAMGRLHRNKGFDVLLRALRRLPGVHLAIAGEGPEAGALRRLAVGEGVAERVHWLGWRQDQAALLAACTVLACPSRVEPLGNVVLEAFSARRPIVAAASEGPAALIDPGHTGLLAPVEDAEALSEALGAVIADQDLALRLGVAGRAAFEREHAEAPVLARWRALLPTLSNAGERR